MIGETFGKERLDDQHEDADEDQRQKDVEAIDREKRFYQDAHFVWRSLCAGDFPPPIDHRN